MTKHTPGPWRLLRPAPECGDKLFVVVGEGVGMIAETPVEGDARLIAQAPDILIALRGLVEHAADGGDGVFEIPYAWINDARAAIARAEGGEA